MNLTNADYHNLVEDSEALYKLYRIERRAAWRRFKKYDEKAKDYEKRHGLFKNRNQV